MKNIFYSFSVLYGITLIAGGGSIPIITNDSKNLSAPVTNTQTDDIPPRTQLTVQVVASTVGIARQKISSSTGYEALPGSPNNNSNPSSPQPSYTPVTKDTPVTVTGYAYTDYRQPATPSLPKKSSTKDFNDYLTELSKPF